MTPNPHWIRRPAAYAVPALMLFLLFEACGGSDSAAADSPEAIEGVWESVATLRDCTSNSALGTFRGAQVFHRGGTMSDTNASPTSTRGPGWGTSTGSGSTFSVRVRFYTYDATGQLSGTMRIQRNVTVVADGNTATSVNAGQAEDVNGAVVRNVCVTDVSTRVR